MVNILVIGATGYIGQALTSSLVRSGTHRVFGLARTPSKAALLASQEITPIQGTISSSLPQTTTLLRTAISTHSINTVIDVSGSNQDSFTILNALKDIAQSRIASNPTIPNLGFIYTSGTWVHGSSLHPVNDLTPVGAPDSPTPPATLTAWRPQLERETLDARDVLDTMIIRPALVYGRASSIWTSLFSPIFHSSKSPSSSDVEIPLDPLSMPGLIHVDDVASGLHAAVDRLPVISGTGVYPVFDLVSSMESMRDILGAVGRVLGARGEVRLVGAGGDEWMEALGTTFNGDSGRAETLLGWRARKVGFVRGMEGFVGAWVAGRGE